MQAQTEKKQDQNSNSNPPPDKLPPKVHSEQQYVKIHNSNYPQQLCESKVMRGSNSNYDTLVEQFYTSQQQASKSYHIKTKNSREFRTQITYIRHLEKHEQFSAYCIVTKESNSGLISHQRFIVASSQYKEVRYYSHIPELPLKSIEEIVQAPKEVIQISKVKKFRVVMSKRGIGQVELSWMDKNESRQWRIKMANNQMAREFVTLIQDIRTGKYKQLTIPDRNEANTSKIFGQSRYQQDRSKVKSSLKNSTASPRSKYLQMSSFSTNIRKSQWSSGSKNTQFANLLLKSMHAEHEAISPPNNKKIEAVKQEQTRMSKEKKVQQGETVAIKPKTQQNDIIPVYHLEPKDSLSSISKENAQPERKQQEDQKQKLTSKGEEERLEKKEDHTAFNKIGDSQKSLGIDQIIKDASIQWIDFQNLNKNDQPNIVLYPTAQQHFLQNDIRERDQTEKKEAMNREIKTIEKVKEPSFLISPKSNRPLSKLQQLVNSKREPDDMQKQIQPGEMGLSKIMVNNLTPKTEKNIQKNSQQPALHHHRQNLLGERKQQAQQSRMTRPATYLNQHSHPRRERSSSPVQYLPLVRPNRWLQRWLLAKSKLQLGEIYCGFVQKCKQKVEQLTSKFQNWHLFHRQGQSYVVVEDEISLTYTMLREEQNQDYLFQKMAHLQYLWDRVNVLKDRNYKGEARIGVPLACIVVYMGLTIFCKAELSHSELAATLVSESTPYEDLLYNLASVAKIHLRNSQIYSITLNKQVYLYIDEGELKPQIPTTPKTSVNEHYIRQYVSGIISSDLHLQLIAQHLHSTLSEQIKQQLSNFHPLSCLQLEAKLQLLGVEISILPLLYTEGSSSFLNRIVLSHLTAQIMAHQVTRGLHQLLLTKNTRKLPSQQIYSLLSSAIRMDSDWVCVELRKRQIEVSLDVLKQALVEQYVMSTLMVLLGLGCQIKQLPKLQDVQRLDGSFWRQLQINEANVQLTFIIGTMTYKAKYFNPHYPVLQSHIFKQQNQTPHIKVTLPLSSIQQYLNASQDKPYKESTSFKLLSVVQKEQLNNYIAHSYNLPLPPQVPVWQEQQHNPQFHLYHFTTCHYYTQDSFEMICNGIKRLLQRRQYLKAEQVLKEQLLRAWIWAKHSPASLIQIQDLSAVVFMFAGRELQTLQSCLMALQIAIKAYQTGQIQPIVVLDKAFKAGSIHRSYHRYHRAAELFATAQCVFEQEVGRIQTKSVYSEFLSKYICVYNDRAQLLLTMGSFITIQEHLHSSLSAYFKMKQHLQHNSESLTLIFEAQFQTYMILFRVYELTAKRVEMLHLTEECSVKFIQNYVEILQKNQQVFEASHLGQRIRKYLRETLKNIWIGIVSICQQSRILADSNLNANFVELKRVNLAEIKDLLLELRKARRKSEAISQEAGIIYLFQLIAKNIQRYQANYQNSLQKRPKSILVQKIIDCLSAISEAHRDPDSSSFNRLLRSQEWSLFESVLSVIGQDRAVGTIQLWLYGQCTSA